ncbi:MAG: TonB-dependent receptor [Dysgonamonadaceae bacterium]|jgi:TonB-linked SusC/RagA family outer membrane protein|nr:TonB-dependent receptor [Dysgonamonadaceae bacterium]
MTKVVNFLLLAVIFFPFFGYAQGNEVKINGRVLDEKTQEPIIGASISLVGAKEGTISDADGNFFLSVRSLPATLSIDYLGYRKQDVDVYESTEPVIVHLRENANFLSEVVVVGYGAQKRKELTGSVSSVSPIALKQQAISFDKLLGGAVAGLNVTQSSGAPGATSTIRIRGSNSITGGNEPLYVIDGLIVYNDNASTRTGVGVSTSAVGSGTTSLYDGGLNPLAFLNASDIESIEVLKDVSATAIYGSRGANGVILITTKKGKRNGNTVNYQASYSVQKINKKLELLNADEWAALYEELDESHKSPYTQYPGSGLLRGEGADWQDAMLRTGHTQNHQLSVSGGGEDHRFLLSGNYTNQEGIIRNTGLERYTGRVNLDKDISSRLNTGVNLTVASSAQRGLVNLSGRESAGRVAGIWDYGLRIPSIVPIYNSDGSFYYNNPFETGDLRIGKQTVNPLSDLLNSTVESKNTSVLGNFYASFKILPELTAKVNAGINSSATVQNLYAPSTSAAGLLVNGYAAIGNKKYSSSLLEFTLDYNKRFNEIHALSLLAGYTTQKTDIEYSNASASNFINESLVYRSLQSASTLITPVSGAAEAILNSYLGRVNYSLLDRYNLSLSFRADGSSRFSKGSQWGYFPSLGASWNIDEEQFFNKSLLSSLKLRGSLGQVGNQEIGDYLYARTYTPRNYSFGNQLVVGYTATNYGNDNLKWESTTQYNIGLDGGLWNDRINFSLDAYYKKTSDLLVDLPVESTTGFSSRTVNIGEISNKGVEFSVNANLVETKDFKWTLLANIAKNVNKIIKLGIDNFVVSDHIVQEGQPLGVFYGYVFDGVVQPGEENSVAVPSWDDDGVQAGEARYKEIKEDGVIDNDDRTVIGNVHPKFTYGFSSNLNYKDFDLSFAFQGSYGNYLYNALRLNLETPTQIYNASKVLADRWTPTHTQTNVPKAQAASFINLDSRYIEDASYLRLKDITLGYNLPVKYTALAHAQVRFFLSGQNLLTFTKYQGYDPEASRNGDNETDELLLGVDLGAYPTAKSFLAGISITF